ncbi:MAG: zf-HC2 domain-containing protein [Dehalococcoidia bacterium]
MKWIEEFRRLLQSATGKPPLGAPSGGITCQEAAAAIFDWLDGELPADRAKLVGDHLETCAVCYPRLVFERSFLEAVSRASRVSEVPAGLRARVVGALAAEGFSLS